MTLGFIIIVSLLSIAINKSIKNKQPLNFDNTFHLMEDETLTSVTHSKEYTLLLLRDVRNNDILRIVSNKTGKILSNTLLSNLIIRDSKELVPLKTY